MKKELSPDFLTHPVVFCVEQEYQIMLPVKSELLVWVRIADENYFDAVNGIMCSSSQMHRVCVPMKALDVAKEYTVCYRRVIERKPYFTTTEPVQEVTYSFQPIDKTDHINIYQLADTHGRVREAICAAEYFREDLDLLILNGDIADHSGSFTNILMIYQIAAGVTEGGIPCVFSRGNHDLRGACAEQLAAYTPNSNGRSYYTFRAGPVWGMVLDCGEDKADEHPEYGNTVCCHTFRRQEAEFIRAVADGSHAEGVLYRLVISHVPFTYDNMETDHDGETPFNIEGPLFTQWARDLKELVQPHYMLCGHLHVCEISYPGGPMDHKGQCCPVIIGSKLKTLDEKEEGYTGTAITLERDRAEIGFTDNLGNEDIWVV